MTDDKLHVWIDRDDTELQGTIALRPLLERLRASSLPTPTAFGGAGRELSPPRPPLSAVGSFTAERLRTGDTIR